MALLNAKNSILTSHRVLGTALLITAVTFIIYLPTLQNDFVNWDDDKYVYENQHIRTLDFNFLKWSFGFQILNWHPLTLISHSIDYVIWGLNPIGHHLSSVILHSVNTFLFFILTLFLFTNSRLAIPITSKTDTDMTSKIIATSVATLLFGLHPIHVESVAWISERKDVLSTFFMLLSLFYYCKYVVTQKRNNPSMYYILSMFFFVFALMSKPMAVTLPLILILLDIYPFQRLTLKNIFEIPSKVVKEKIPFFFFSLIASVLTIIAQSSGDAIISLKSVPFLSRILISIRGVTFYLEKMIFPVGLAPMYPLPKNISFGSFEYTFSITIVALITVFCLMELKRGRKVFIVVWAYYIITLLPVIGIIQIGEQAVADRYFYIPGMGLFLLIGLGISLIWEKINSQNNGYYTKSIKTIFIFMGIALFLSLSMITVKQIGIWRNSITLWSYELEKYPNLPLAYFNRAYAYSINGQYQQAIEDLDNALTYKPKYPQAYYIRAINNIALKNNQKALKDLDIAIQYDPRFSRAYYIRAQVYMLLKDYQSALKDLDKVIELKYEFVTEAHRKKIDISQQQSR